MQLEKLEGANICRVRPGEGERLLSGEQAALDLLATVRYETGCDSLLVHKEDIDPRFFDLSTRLAGGVLQKFVNYGAALAIVGDFAGFGSQSLQDFMRESNRGRTVFFVADEKAARLKLGG